ncbi:glycosyltransferase [Corynebacterium mendelii]|uniref:Glycosyltransferase n=1 Tax=Corynebacterium mendelii TaxID=2765362 RepID=A0A939E0S8_9CORY|nr:glycosyltransferase [Corynebacterium mendelii]MBN9644324.1 hypothetical protein [Corynebacterium mendelii]
MTDVTAIIAVSVDTPVDFLTRSLASVVAQTHPIDAILVAAPARLHPEAESILRAPDAVAAGVRYIVGDPQAGAGDAGDGAAALDQALASCGTEFIMRLDAGDVAHNERTARALEEFARADRRGRRVDVVGTAVYEFDASLEFSSPLELISSAVSVRSFPTSPAKATKAAVPVLATTVTARRAALTAAGGWAGGSDRDLWRRIIDGRGAVVSLPQPLTWHCAGFAVADGICPPEGRRHHPGGWWATVKRLVRFGR